MHSTNSVIRFVLIMTSVVSIVLTFLAVGLKNIHDKNEAIYNKKATLSAIADHLDQPLTAMNDSIVEGIFASKIDQVVIDMNGNPLTKEEIIAKGYKKGRAEDIDLGKERKKPLADQIIPLFVYKKDDGKKLYIMSVRGNGLWDEIWGCIALEDDFNTISGVAFDHQAETPGLGAEIKDNDEFKKSFIGTKLYTESGEFKSVNVRKGGAKHKTFEVDRISGATITADGVTEMMKRGLKYYEPYINTLKKNKG